jgi:hypothetical protein
MRLLVGDVVADPSDLQWLLDWHANKGGLFSPARWDCKPALAGQTYTQRMDFYGPLKTWGVPESQLIKEKKGNATCISFAQYYCKYIPHKDL